MQQNKKNALTPQELLLQQKLEEDAVKLVSQNKSERIEGFTGYFSFLKPEFPAKVLY